MTSSLQTFTHGSSFVCGSYPHAIVTGVVMDNTTYPSYDFVEHRTESKLTTGIIKDLIPYIAPQPSKNYTVVGHLQTNFNPFRFDTKTNSYSTDVEVPGFSKETLKLSLDETKRKLTITGTSKTRGSLWKEIDLPAEGDTTTIDAKVTDGLMTITLRKLSNEEIQARKNIIIPIF
jgi:HSP20 family molecular chaperone IbpA